MTILEDGSDERQQKESRIKSHMLSCSPACSKGAYIVHWIHIKVFVRGESANMQWPYYSLLQ